jgi:hypothetical protein
MEFIERLVEIASGKSKSIQEQNDYYEKHLSSGRNFNLEECVDQALHKEESSQRIPVLRSFETLDIEALTRGFEQEEINEKGKLVLYITEKQLLQLLSQRAIIVPDKNEILKSSGRKSLSLIDEKIGERFGHDSSLKEVELIVDQQDQQDQQDQGDQEEQQGQEQQRETLDEYEQVTLVQEEQQELEEEIEEIREEKVVEFEIDQENYKAIQSLGNLSFYSTFFKTNFKSISDLYY